MYLNETSGVQWKNQADFILIADSRYTAQISLSEIIVDSDSQDIAPTNGPLDLLIFVVTHSSHFKRLGSVMHLESPHLY